MTDVSREKRDRLNHVNGKCRRARAAAARARDRERAMGRGRGDRGQTTSIFSPMLPDGLRAQFSRVLGPQRRPPLRRRQPASTRR